MTEAQEKQLKETHETIIALSPMIKDHHKTLYGNGRKGIKDRVTELEATRKALILFVTVGGFLVMAAGVAVAFFK